MYKQRASYAVILVPAEASWQSVYARPPANNQVAIGVPTPQNHCTCRQEFERLAAQAPEVLNLLQTIILRSISLSASHALEALERSGVEF